MLWLPLKRRKAQSDAARVPVVVGVRTGMVREGKRGRRGAPRARAADVRISAMQRAFLRRHEALRVVRPLSEPVALYLLAPGIGFYLRSSFVPLNYGEPVYITASAASTSASSFTSASISLKRSSKVFGKTTLSSESPATRRRQSEAGKGKGKDAHHERGVCGCAARASWK